MNFNPLFSVAAGSLLLAGTVLAPAAFAQSVTGSGGSESDTAMMNGEPDPNATNEISGAGSSSTASTDVGSAAMLASFAGGVPDLGALGFEQQGGNVCFNGCCVDPNCVVQEVGTLLTLRCGPMAAVGGIEQAAECVRNADEEKYQNAKSCSTGCNFAALPGGGTHLACSGSSSIVRDLFGPSTPSSWQSIALAES